MENNCSFQENNDRRPADEIFQTRDGKHLTVFNSYHYSIKTGRNYNHSLAATRRTGISTFRIDTEVKKEYFAMYPSIGHADLITSTAPFAARKVRYRG